MRKGSACGRFGSVTLCLAGSFALLSCGSPLFLRPVPANEVASRITGKHFLSNRGKWVGMDGDVGFSFGPKQQVRLTIYGFAVRSHDGLYRVRATDGKVLLKFNDGYRNPEFTEMMLKTNGRRLYLNDGWYAEVSEPPFSSTR